MNTKRVMIVIPKTGITDGSNKVRALYDPAIAKLMEAVGEVHTQRASHVEPGSALSQEALLLLRRNPDTRGMVNSVFWFPFNKQYKIVKRFANHWFADMTPAGIHRVLGPFPPDARDAALAAEVALLIEHNIPVPPQPE